MTTTTTSSIVRALQLSSFAALMALSGCDTVPVVSIDGGTPFGGDASALASPTPFPRADFEIEPLGASALDHGLGDATFEGDLAVPERAGELEQIPARSPGVAPGDPIDPTDLELGAPFAATLDDLPTGLVEGSRRL